MGVILVTGNKHKAAYALKHCPYITSHQSLDLDEIQSLDLKEIVEHKVRQAYAKIGQPVLVEDVSLVIEALGGLPGPFVRFFNELLGLEGMTQLIPETKSRAASFSILYGYYDGQSEPRFFRGSVDGEIAMTVMDGPAGFGFSAIFIPRGHEKSLAQLSQTDFDAMNARYQALVKVNEFLADK